MAPLQRFERLACHVPAELAACWPSLFPPTRCMHAWWVLCRYENIVQIRCLYEGVDPHDMLQRWHDMLPDYMQRWQLDRGEVRSCRALASCSGGTCRNARMGCATGCTLVALAPCTCRSLEPWHGPS